jgi:hypothetical protein
MRKKGKDSIEFSKRARREGELYPRCNAVRRELELPSTPFNDHLGKVYYPLKSIRNEAKLLKFSSGLEDERLIFSLERISLDGDAPYTAATILFG